MWAVSPVAHASLLFFLLTQTRRPSKQIFSVIMDIAVVDLPALSSAVHVSEGNGKGSLEAISESICHLVADSLQRTGCVIVSEFEFSFSIPCRFDSDFLLLYLKVRHPVIESKDNDAFIDLVSKLRMLLPLSVMCHYTTPCNHACRLV